MYYNNSSLAYDIGAQQNDEIQVTKAVKPKKKKSYSGFLVFICAVYIIASITSLLFKTAGVNEKKTKLETVKAQYEEIVNENKKLEVSINSKIDLRKVEDIAISQLNMNKPKNNQIVYINTSPLDYGEVIEPEKESRKDGLLASVVKTFTGIFAYSN